MAAGSSIKEQQRKSKKLHFTLETPYSAVVWPEISSEDQAIFLDLLVSLISPWGAYKREHIVPSKGKGARSNPKDGATNINDTNMDTSNAYPDLDIDEAPPAPPLPNIAEYLTIGINETTELLSQHARANLPPSFPSYLKTAPNTMSNNPATDTSSPSPSIRPCPVAIFVTPGPAHLTAHLPLVSITSSPKKGQQQPRLIRLTNPLSSQKLSEALAIPRVSTIGILDCPEARALLDLCLKKVPPISVPWLNSGNGLEGGGEGRMFQGTVTKVVTPSDEQWKKREERRKMKAARKAATLQKAKAAVQ